MVAQYDEQVLPLQVQECYKLLMLTTLDEAQVQGLKVNFQILFQTIETKLASSLSNILWHDTTSMDLLLSHWFKEH